MASGGDVRTLAASKFWFADGEKPCWKPEGTIETISVRAHASNLPDLDNLICLNRDPDRLAFVYAWVMAKKTFQDGDKSYEKILKSFATRVKFWHLADEEAAEKKKWELAQDVRDDCEALVLQGWRQIKAVGLLRALLKSVAKSEAAEYMEKWLGSRVNLKATKIKAMLKIYDRFQDSPGCEQLIIQLDDAFSSNHAFAHMMAFDLVTGKTALPKVPAQQRALMLWTLEIIVADMLEGRCALKPNKDAMTMMIYRALLKRRLCTLVANKFKGPDGGDVAKCEGGMSPATALSTVFASVASFRSSGLADQSYVSLPWLAALPSYTSEALHFGAKLLRGHSGFDELLETAVTSDALIPAETFLLSKTWKADLFDYAGLLEQKKSGERPPVVEVAEPAAVEAPPAETENAAEMMPDVSVDVVDVEPAAALPTSVDRTACFNRLVVPESIMTTINEHDDHYFNEVKDWARIRVQTFLEFEIKEEKAAARRAQVTRLYEKHGSKPMFIIYDCKARLREMKDDLLGSPWKRPVPIAQADLKAWVTSFFMDVKAKDKLSPQMREKDLFVFADGRSPANYDVIHKLLQTTLKDVSMLPKRRFTIVRRSYSNDEFGSGGYASPRRKSGLTPHAPDPLENLFMVMPKEYELPYRESACPSVISNNFVRGWQGLSLMTEHEQAFSVVTNHMYAKLARKPEGDSETKTEEMGSLRDDASGPEDAPAPEKKTEDTLKVYLQPWDNGEAHQQLLVDLYMPSGGSAHVVSLEASVSLAIACCRKRWHATLFVESEQHRQLLSQILVLKIMYEIMSGRADGFVMRQRILTRQASLSGSDSGRPPLPPPTPAPSSATAGSMGNSPADKSVLEELYGDDVEEYDEEGAEQEEIGG
ncbi:unnamed protein product [Symbiodinium sp. CCMP2592]|nr:unnamed protein product [Symbiodinium sp. CCMP2592]